MTSCYSLLTISLVVERPTFELGNMNLAGWCASSMVQNGKALLLSGFNF